jgi:manganese/zinc/iron transport system permease protein
MTEFLQLDFPPLLAAMLAGGTCGLLGSFLVLRRESLLGDALSHAVLPGIVAGFALTGLRSAWPMLAGCGAWRSWNRARPRASSSPASSPSAWCCWK